ncbi:MAG: hypothetical protein K6G50_02965, partial [bacterium]|nr:hypothetical protein [bacterium]
FLFFVAKASFLEGSHRFARSEVAFYGTSYRYKKFAITILYWRSNICFYTVRDTFLFFVAKASFLEGSHRFASLAPKLPSTELATAIRSLR